MQKEEKEKLGDVQTRGGQAGLYFGDKKIWLLRGLAVRFLKELTRPTPELVEGLKPPSK